MQPTRNLLRPDLDLLSFIWDFRGTLFWGPYNKDPTIEGTILGSQNFGNPPYLKNSAARLGFKLRQVDAETPRVLWGPQLMATLILGYSFPTSSIK